MASRNGGRHTSMTPRLRRLRKEAKASLGCIAPLSPSQKTKQDGTEEIGRLIEQYYTAVLTRLWRNRSRLTLLIAMFNTTAMKNSPEVSQYLNRVVMWPEISLLGIYPREWNRGPHKSSYTDDHRSFLYKNMKTIQISFNWREDKQNVIDPWQKYHLTMKKKSSIEACSK